MFLFLSILLAIFGLAVVFYYYENNEISSWHSQKLGKEEQKKIYESHLEYVDKLAKKLINQGLDKGLPIEVLVKEGRLGLRKAAENFDPSKGYKFSTYAYFYMRRRMLRAILVQRSIPDAVTYMFQKQKKIYQKLMSLKNLRN